MSVCIQHLNVSVPPISQWPEASILVSLTLSRIPEMPEAPVNTELAAPLCPQLSMALTSLCCSHSAFSIYLMNTRLSPAPGPLHMLTLPLTIFSPRLLCVCFTLELSDHSSP